MSFKDFPYGYSGDAAGTTDSWFEDVLYSTPKRPSEEEEIQSRLREDRIAKEVVRRQALIKDAGLDRYYDGAVIAFKKGKLTFVSFKMKDKWYTTGKLSVALSNEDLGFWIFDGSSETPEIQMMGYVDFE